MIRALGIVKVRKMEPPFKRPRLSMFRDIHDSDYSLAVARDRNDRRLKSRWESIFDKYERDFSDVADEIDIRTGEIIVNKGHLASMQDERDNGASRSRQKTSSEDHDSQDNRYEGRRLLRAMTVAPRDHNAPPPSVEDEEDDDVLVLFERIAQTAAPKTTFSGAQIKEESPSSDEVDFSGDTALSSHYGYDSDRDSLLEESRSLSRSRSPSSLPRVDRVRPRSGSLDSLLEEERGHLGSSRLSSGDSLLNDDPPANRRRDGASMNESYEVGQSNGNLDNDGILEQYGPYIGPQILEVLRRRSAMEEEKIEPAWRLPGSGPSFEKNFAESSADNDPPPDEDFVFDNDLQTDSSIISPKMQSLWESTGSSRRSTRTFFPPPPARTRASSVASDGSEDPLSADFKALTGKKEVHDQVFLEEWQYNIEHNICPYCKQHKIHLTQHFRLMVDKGADGVHDVVYLNELCKSRQMGECDLKLFLEIVKYKELEELGFKEIAKKLNASLKLVYNTYYQYRVTQKTNEELAAEGKAWSNDEDNLILEIAKDPAATFREAKTAVPGRKYGEIGNRLATLRIGPLKQQGPTPQMSASEETAQESFEVRIKDEPPQDNAMLYESNPNTLRKF
ncbi:putative myb-like dna-binding domain protein [Phaeomoniella chlamydospora]|uniref:Putative myb-like dna-binding domain protein n=1 Tax=Phaeomoniella chlamydospora TaxID=158046 RepID=A0A0G2GDG9_PHACM|nr:putative myb-like dna-binding domain protein [Phaeomoniella chlamydospora]